MKLDITTFHTYLIGVFDCRKYLSVDIILLVVSLITETGVEKINLVSFFFDWTYSLPFVALTMSCKFDKFRESHSVLMFVSYEGKNKF